MDHEHSSDKETVFGMSLLEGKLDVARDPSSAENSVEISIPQNWYLTLSQTKSLAEDSHRLQLQCCVPSLWSPPLVTSRTVTRAHPRGPPVLRGCLG